jgi:hypothetical protein
MMKNTIDDLQRWKNKVEGWVRGFSGKSNNQSTEGADRRNKSYDQSTTSATQPPKLTSTSLSIAMAN